MTETTAVQCKPWAAMVTLSLGFFIAILDMTIVNVAIPSMAVYFNKTINDTLWVINVYILIMASCVFFFGKAGERFGYKQTFQSGMFVFMIGSLFCGMSPSLLFLTISRIIQASGAAMLMPQIISIIKKTFPVQAHSWAFGLWSATGGVAAITGPTLGGFLVSYFSWRFIFLINIPISIIVIIMTHFFVDNIKDNNIIKIDIIGIVLSFFLLGTFSFLLMSWNQNGFLINYLMIFIVILLLLSFVFQQKYNQNNDPVIPFGVLSNKNFSAMIFIILLNALTIYSLTIIVSVSFQENGSLNALKTGFLLAPASLFSTVFSFCFSYFNKLCNLFVLLFIGLLITFIGVSLMAYQYWGGYDFYLCLMIMSVLGIGNGPAVPAMNTLAMGNVDGKYTGTASGILNTFRQTGMLIAGATVSLLLSMKLSPFSSTNTMLFVYLLPVISSFLCFLFFTMLSKKGG